ncbi:MAG: NUDIX domain-containing protein [Nitriliruptorales bacterium]
MGEGPARFETLASEVTHDGVLSRVRVDRVRTPSDEIVEREVVEHGDAVAIVPLMDDGAVVLLRQYRQPFGDHQLEIPAGKLDVEGESGEAAARRELAEETGLEAGSLRLLATFRNSAGWTDETTTIYLGTDLADVGPPDGFSPKAEEAHMEVVRLPLEAAIEAVRDGTIVDAKTALGLLLAAGPEGPPH